MITIALSSLPALAGSPETLEHLGARYTVLSVDLRRETIDLYGQGDRGRPHTHEELTAVLGTGPWAATNAGIFHTPDRPVGLWIDQGAQRSPLELADGRGNFFLKPNGVFWIDDAGAHVTDAARFEATSSIRLATQSGPALVLEDAIHPAFLPASSSLKLRSGVGVSDPHTVHLVISEGPVRFHDLATLFRDVLGCSDALYLDGTISGLWAGAHTGPAQVPYAGFLVVTPGKEGP